ncbi:hypothetical protein SSS_03380, partial [Sarcoptes scabiei]
IDIWFVGEVSNFKIFRIFFFLNFSIELAMNETNKTDVNFDAEFINFYTDLSSIENTFRLFNHGTCYTLHDENAEYVSKNFLNTIESLKITKIDGVQISSIYISQTRFSSLIRYLLVEIIFRSRSILKLIQNPLLINDGGLNMKHHQDV